MRERARAAVDLDGMVFSSSECHGQALLDAAEHRRETLDELNDAVVRGVLRLTVGFEWRGQFYSLDELPDEAPYP